MFGLASSFVIPVIGIKPSFINMLFNKQAILIDKHCFSGLIYCQFVTLKTEGRDPMKTRMFITTLLLILFTFLSVQNSATAEDTSLSDNQLSVADFSAIEKKGTASKARTITNPSIDISKDEYLRFRAIIQNLYIKNGSIYSSYKLTIVQNGSVIFQSKDIIKKAKTGKKNGYIKITLPVTVSIPDKPGTQHITITFKDLNSSSVVSATTAYQVINSDTTTTSDDSPLTDVTYLPVWSPENKKWGFCDLSGKIVIPCKYTLVLFFKEGLAAVKYNGKWGYVDSKGQAAISFRYNGAKDFSEGLAAVKSGNKWGYINKKGSLIIKPSYSWAGHFTEGYSKIKHSSNFIRLINKKGQMVFHKQQIKQGNRYINTTMDHFDNFSEGMAPVSKLIHYTEEKRSDGKIVMKGRQSWGFIDSSGRLVIPPQFAEVRPFKNGLAPAQDEESYKWGFIDKSGKWFIKPQWDNAWSFSNGLAHVENREYTDGKSHKWHMSQPGFRVNQFRSINGYINTSGKYIIPPGRLKVKEARSFRGKFAYVQVAIPGVAFGGRGTLIDHSGNIMDRPGIDSMTVMPNEYIFFTKEEGKLYIQGYMDSSFKVIYTWKDKNSARPIFDD